MQMCSPDKNKESDFEDDDCSLGNETLSDFIDSEDDERAKERMDKLLLTFPELDKTFNLHGQVGEGTFSAVYVASLKNGDSNIRYALKHVVPTCHPDRIKFEFKCLKEIGGEDNVATVNWCFRNGNDVLFIMPYHRHDIFSEYVGKMDVEEAALYMKSLLRALARVHQFKIIHRDIKPNNFLYDRSTRKFLLVDFGLAQKQSNSKEDSKSPDNNKNNKRKCKVVISESQSSIDRRSVLQEIETKSPNTSRSLSKSTPPDMKQKENSGNVCMEGKIEKNQTKAENKNVTYVKYEKSPEVIKIKSKAGCGCYGKPRICSVCSVYKPMQAARAGTPGFRPPEVLLKYCYQTTAVDIWASGIIFLSILSKCRNFFVCPNDTAALLDLITLFGFEKIKKVANKLGRYLITSEKKPPLDLRKLCCVLRMRGEKLNKILIPETCKTCKESVSICLCPSVPLHKSIPDVFPDTAYDLLLRLLDLDPDTRITAEEALNHPFLINVSTS